MVGDAGKMAAEATGADAETDADEGTVVGAEAPPPPPLVDLWQRAERRAAPFGPEERGHRDLRRAAQRQRA